MVFLPASLLLPSASTTRVLVLGVAANFPRTTQVTGTHLLSSHSTSSLGRSAFVHYVSHDFLEADGKGGIVNSAFDCSISELICNHL